MLFKKNMMSWRKPWTPEKLETQNNKHPLLSVSWSQVIPYLHVLISMSLALALALPILQHTHLLLLLTFVLSLSQVPGSPSNQNNRKWSYTDLDVEGILSCLFSFSFLLSRKICSDSQPPSPSVLPFSSPSEYPQGISLDKFSIILNPSSNQSLLLRAPYNINFLLFSFLGRCFIIRIR